MRRHIVVSVLSGFFGSALLLILLSAAGTVGAQSGEVRAEVSRVNSAAATLTSTFTYKGQLTSNSVPINTLCDFQFSLYDAFSAGNRIGITQTVSSVSVSHGLFTALLNTGNEFGDSAFNGDARWLSIGVRCPAGGGGYTSLSPLEPLTSLPFALPGLRTFPNATSPNIVGGYSGNFISSTVVGGVIGGGGASGFPNRVQSDNATIGGGQGNTATAYGYGATVGGGDSNTASSLATVGGGYHNTASGDYATVGGGNHNTATVYGDNATIGGGDSNTASDIYATIGGGRSNTASNSYATVGGGSYNTANGDHATVGGGWNNTANGNYSMILGGSDNTVAGTNSMAGGYHAFANGDGCFAWGDTSTTDGIYCNGNNLWSIRSTGGFYFYPGNNAFCSLTDATGWQCSSLSDHNAKANIANVDNRDILARLATIPIQTWNYKTQDATVRHIGPMAQDFYAAFNVGADDKHINPVDSEGVALAAIQGLYQTLQDKDAQIAQLQTRLSSLEQNQQPASFNWFNLLSVIAFGAVAVMWLHQRRSTHGGRS